MDKNEDFLNRINEAIKNGDAKQVRIAEYCNVSEQAVARWKKTGQISRENLMALSEISGFRYIYLRDGTLPKRLASVTENRKEYMVAENTSVYYANQTNSTTPELDHLIEQLKVAHANKALTNSAIQHLTSFIQSLSLNR